MCVCRGKEKTIEILAGVKKFVDKNDQKDSGREKEMNRLYKKKFSFGNVEKQIQNWI